MKNPLPFIFRRRQQDPLLLVYRPRVVHRRSTPDNPSRCDVICAAFWEEQEIRLEGKAKDRGYELWWEEVQVHSRVSPDRRPETVFIVFEGGLAQDAPEALGFSDPVGLAVYFTRGEIEAALKCHADWEWENVWELPVPWQSPFALNPFTRKHSSSSPEDYECTL